MKHLITLTDAELDAEISDKANEVRIWEAIADGEDNVFNRQIARSILDEYITDWRRAMDEQRRRLGI